MPEGTEITRGIWVAATEIGLDLDHVQQAMYGHPAADVGEGSWALTKERR